MHDLFLISRFLLMMTVLNVVPVSRSLATETFFYIVKKADWLTYANPASLRPPSFSQNGFTALLTPEQVVPTARALQDQQDLLLLELSVSTADPHLKWERVPGSDVSFPRYYGDFPRQLVQKIYPFQRQKDGNFALPDDPLMKRIMNRAIPERLVSKLLNYQDWQDIDPFHQLQVDNFLRPKVQLQWWYFDFFLRDGSSVVLAFIPQHWWDKPGLVAERKAVFMMSLRTKEGTVKRLSVVVPQGEIKTSADQLEIPSRLVIRAVGHGQDRQYSIRVNFPEVTGVFTIRPTQPPFAAYPSGVMPSILQTVLSGVPLGSPSFSYVSQIPNSRVSGSLTWDEYQTKLDGQAYHEQGRLDDTPERQGANWTWYHFAGNGWNIFGSPGTYIYLQQDDRIVRSGFHVITKDYTLRNRTYSSPDHAKIMTGGEISFRHQNVVFTITLSPASSKTLICFPSTDPNQVWGTVEGTATLSVSEGSDTKVLEGRMFLETCSWETNTKI